VACTSRSQRTTLAAQAICSHEIRGIDAGKVIDQVAKIAEKEQRVAAVERAISILDAFSANDISLSLHDLATRTGLYKSTILRLVSSLERRGCMHRMPDGRYQLGHRLLHSSRVYQSSLRIENHVLPVLNLLVSETGEGASFYKRQGEMRICLYRVNSQCAIREYVMPGDLLPLQRGAAGRVLIDFATEARQFATAANPVYVSFGESDPEVTAIAAPVFGSMNQLAGALSVSGPRNRMTKDVLSHVSDCVLRAAVTLTVRLGGDPTLLQHDTAA
jgi:DNA-binding IclR family transcriptional regulator